MIPSVAAGVFAAPVSAIDDLSLTVSGGAGQVAPGDTVTVTLDVANLSAAINGVQALIRYDDTLLTLVNVIPTDLGLASPNAGWVEVFRSETAGDLTYAVAINGDAASLDQTVATLTFTAIAEGTTSFVFRADSDPFFTKLTLASDNSTILPGRVDSGSILITCQDGLFCNGVETFFGGVCEAGTDPCAPLICDEVDDICLAPVQIVGLELFYTGRFFVCRGGIDDGTACTLDADCSDGRCTEQSDPGHAFLGTGSTATVQNTTNYARGVTGVRVLFNQIVDFATTPEASVGFEWTTGSGDVFSPVADAATMISVTPLVENGVTVLRIVLAENHVRRRWLKVTVDSTQVTSTGVELDGELSGSPMVFPSGDTVPGGNAVFYVGNASGDADGDLKTSLVDVAIIRLSVNPFVSVGITDDLDIDKDGRLLLNDVAEARLDVNPFFTLPRISP